MNNIPTTTSTIVLPSPAGAAVIPIASPAGAAIDTPNGA